jgi:polysaccharide deacetylase family protein (PEP-CTERM system associated)
MPEACRVMTVDVEEWFHICGAGPALAPDRWPLLPSRVVDTTMRLLDILDRTGTTATFFVLGQVAERHPALIERIAAAGHEIGSHGHTHTRVYELTPASFSIELNNSMAALSSCGISRVTGFRAPEWSINDKSLWALEVLADKGFLFDSSMAPMRVVGNPDYPQAPHWRPTGTRAIAEFPPAVTRRMGQRVPFGGGWGLRMSSPRSVLREIERRTAAGLASVLWVHPWEVDPDPPRIRLPAAKRFAHYFRLDGFSKRLEAILRDGHLGTMGALLREMPS